MNNNLAHRSILVAATLRARRVPDLPDRRAAQPAAPQITEDMLRERAQNAARARA